MKYHQGKYTPRNPEKYQGNPANIFFRSAWERKFMCWCDCTSDVVSWSSEEIVIPYFCPTDNKTHRYFPDALIKVRESSGQIKTYLVEIKPECQTKPPVAPKRKTKRFLQEVLTWGKNEAKWKSAREYCADRNYTFVIITEKHLFGDKYK